MPVVQQVALVLKTSEKLLCSYFQKYKMIKNVPIKWLIVSVEHFGILYRASKCPILYDKYIGKSMVLYNLQD